MRLQDIMETTVDTVARSESAERAWGIMQARNTHHLVVMEGGTIVGVLAARDLGGAKGAAIRRNATVGDLMTASVVTASPSTTLREAANLMRGRAVGCLPIVEDGKLAGIVTVTDLLELIGKGAERPTATGRRPTLATRGPRRRPFVGATVRH